MTTRQLVPPTCSPDSIWEATLSPYYFPTLLVADSPATAEVVAEHLSARKP